MIFNTVLITLAVYIIAEKIEYKLFYRTLGDYIRKWTHK